MADPGVTFGLDVGGTKCLGLAVSARDEVLAESRVDTPVGAPALLKALVGLVGDLVAQVPSPVAVGVGAPGLVDRDGVLRYAPNLPGITELPLRAELHKRVSVPVTVDNDATCAAWGERQAGAARHRNDVLLVTLGTGIGGGAICNGVLLRGANGFAGEVGHMVVDPNGPPCPCGQRGCWERFASGSGLGRLGREAAHAGIASRMVALAGGDPEAVRGEHVTAAALEGDAPALEVIERFARWVALGLVNLANAFDPEAFVIGGGLVDMGELLLGPVRAAFPRLAFAADHRPPVEIVPAALGEQAGAIGAAALAREEG